MIYIFMALLLFAVFIIAHVVNYAEPPAAPVPPPAPARGPLPPVTWEMKFFRFRPVHSEITLRQEFYADDNIEEVLALWSLEMKDWWPCSVPHPVPPEAVRCSD